MLINPPLSERNEPRGPLTRRLLCVLTRNWRVIGLAVAYTIGSSLLGLALPIIGVLPDADPVGCCPRGPIAVAASLYSTSLIGDAVFLAGSLCAFTVAFVVRRTRGVAWAMALVGATYVISATVSFAFYMPGEGEVTPPGQDLLYWLLAAPTFGCVGLLFSLAAFIYVRRLRRSEAGSVTLDV